MTHDPLSQTSYYIETSKNGTALMSGTCFFVKRGERTYLVTNWHNVTGLNPKTKEHLTKFAVQPDTLTAKIYKNQPTLALTDLTIQLYKNTVPVWIEHPVHKEKVDVVAIEVNIPSDKLVCYVEDSIEPFNEKTKANVKDDVYVLGYPFGLSTGDIFPIWKRASVASEPIIDIDGLPKMYIDTASRPGMSGAPVVYKEKRSIGQTDGDLGKPGVKSSWNLMQFVGVYSGRIGADIENMAQLGIVWKQQVIDEIINTK
jgi:S1-C subfamily serine protease